MSINAFKSRLSLAGYVLKDFDYFRDLRDKSKENIALIIRRQMVNAVREIINKKIKVEEDEMMFKTAPLYVLTEEEMNGLIHFVKQETLQSVSRLGGNKIIFQNGTDLDLIDNRFDKINRGTFVSDSAYFPDEKK